MLAPVQECIAQGHDEGMPQLDVKHDLVQEVWRTAMGAQVENLQHAFMPLIPVRIQSMPRILTRQATLLIQFPVVVRELRLGVGRVEHLQNQVLLVCLQIPKFAPDFLVCQIHDICEHFRRILGCKPVALRHHLGIVALLLLPLLLCPAPEIQGLLCILFFVAQVLVLCVRIASSDSCLRHGLFALCQLLQLACDIEFHSHLELFLQMLYLFNLNLPITATTPTPRRLFCYFHGFQVCAD
mmetsp:Transcript_121858/g.272093  ORF Transcript_121858/g.272093 Transcript_121858/m.272093 type:complete len:240 (-) Transcript_121858:491-1210(-)